MLLVLPSGLIINWEEYSSISMDVSTSQTHFFYIEKGDRTEISEDDYKFLSSFKEGMPRDGGRLRDDR